MEIVARSPNDIARAYAAYYNQMADIFAKHIHGRRIRLILEAGCGRGQLTIPLLRKLPDKVRMIVLDSSRGPYRGWLDELAQLLAEAKLESRVDIIEADATRIVDVDSRSVDAVVSNELLCDLVPRARLVKALREFWRVLRGGGMMLHGEWSSHSDSGSRSIMIKHWPSWTPDQLHSVMLGSGFTNFTVIYFETTIRFQYEAALEELRNWGATSRLLRRRGNLVKGRGFRLPFEHIMRCEKRPAADSMTGQ